MTTKRVPIARPLRPAEIPPAALDLFAEMRAITCTCDPTDIERDDCAGCEQWWSLHSELRAMLPKCPPWDYPIIENSDEPCAPGCRPNPSARERWRELEALLDARDRGERVAPAPEV